MVKPGCPFTNSDRIVWFMKLQTEEFMIIGDNLHLRRGREIKKKILREEFCTHFKSLCNVIPKFLFLNLETAVTQILKFYSLKLETIGMYSKCELSLTKEVILGEVTGKGRT